jgi:hypothetical protein
VWSGGLDGQKWKRIVFVVVLFRRFLINDGYFFEKDQMKKLNVEGADAVIIFSQQCWKKHLFASHSHHVEEKCVFKVL